MAILQAVNDRNFTMRLLNALPLLAALTLAAAPAAWSQEDAYNLKVEVSQVDNTFETHASFKLPISACHAWKYMVDYDDATAVPGVVASKSTRLEANKVRVERQMRDTILFFPIRMHSVIDFTEIAESGTDFVQVEGEAKSHRGSWRLRSGQDGTEFRYHAISEPDSALPMAVIRYFLDKRLRSSFAAMAQYGAKRKYPGCD